MKPCTPFLPILPILRILLLLLLLSPAPAAEEAPAKVVDLRVESQTNPTAVNNPLPNLGWRVESSLPGWIQRSYQILVASSVDLLAENKGDLWDSGETPALSSQFIAYGGPPLRTGQEAYWKVRTASRNGTETTWSDPGHFTVSLTGPAPLPTTLFLPDAPRLSHFESSDARLNALYDNAAARLHEITGLRDIAFAMRAAAYHQALLPRAADWNNVLHHSTDKADFYPAKLPSDGSYGSTQSDAALSATHALWWMTGDTSILERHTPTMQAYVFARMNADPDQAGVPFGDLPADTFAEGDPTPPSFVHLGGQAANIRLLLDMNRYATKNPYDALALQKAQEHIGTSYKRQHLRKDGALKHASVTATLMALRSGLLDPKEQESVSAQFLSLLPNQAPATTFPQSPYIAGNILPGLTWTKSPEAGLDFVRSLDPENTSPLGLACVSEWLMSIVAGIDAESPGFRNVIIQPLIPEEKKLSFVKAHYDSPNGRITTHWRYENGRPLLDVTIPPNTAARIKLPNHLGTILTADGETATSLPQYPLVEAGAEYTFIRAVSGSHQFKFSD